MQSSLNIPYSFRGKNTSAFDLSFPLDCLENWPSVLILLLIDYIGVNNTNTEDLFEILPIYSIDRNKSSSKHWLEEAKALFLMCQPLIDACNQVYTGWHIEKEKLHLAKLAFDAISRDQNKVEIKPHHTSATSYHCGPLASEMTTNDALNLVFMTSFFGNWSKKKQKWTCTFAESLENKHFLSSQLRSQGKELNSKAQAFLKQSIVVHVTKEISEVLYLHIARLGKSDQLLDSKGTLKNNKKLDEFLKALEILEIKTSNIQINGIDDYFVMMNKNNYRKIANIYRNNDLLNILYNGLAPFNAKTLLKLFNQVENTQYRKEIYKLMNLVIDTDVFNLNEKDFLINQIEELNKYPRLTDKNFKNTLSLLLASLQSSFASNQKSSGLSLSRNTE